MKSRIVYICSVVLLVFVSQSLSQEVHQCVHAVNKMRKAGYGDTDTSCMGCDPALPDCFTDCQPLVAQLYVQCDGVCLPEGYYFDPQSELTGCWKDVKPDVKIKVERCGCNSAFSTVSRIPLVSLIFVIIISVYSLL